MSSPDESMRLPEEDWDCDAAVIGGGPGGEDAARELAAGGMKVCLVNDAPLPGGECLWRGCIPSKTWRAAADRLRDRKRDEAFGVLSTGGGRLDWSVLENFRKSLLRERGELALATDLKSKIDVIEARAKFTGGHEMELAVKGDRARRITFGAAVIATGAPAFMPPISGLREGVEKGAVLTSETLWDLSERPERLAIVGAGAIGLEMAQIFSDFGSEVVLVEMMDRILPEMERGLALGLQAALSEEARLDIHCSAKVTSVEGGPGDAILRFADGQGEERVVGVDRVLMATGKRPVLDGLGLEAAGVERKGAFIAVDDACRTSAAHIFAVGDVIGGLMLAHTASAQGRVAAENLLGGRAAYRAELDGGVVFTRPQVASAGLSLEQAKARGLDAGEMKYPLSFDVKAQLNFETHGMMKLVAEKGSGRILGAHILADHADALIGEAVAMLAGGMTLEQLASAIHPHPTQTENWGEMARRLRSRFRRR